MIDEEGFVLAVNEDALNRALDEVTKAFVAVELSFVAVSPNRLTPAGELGVTRHDEPRDYRCEVSCVDWYGNSRPIFTRGRIFALMGTDLVEGRMDRGRIGEVARVDLTGPIDRRPKVATRS